MSNLARVISVSAASAAAAVVMVVAFLWVGPGMDAIRGDASAAVLYDEDAVVGIYEKVSPAVVEIVANREMGGLIIGAGTGSGFLIDAEGHIVTSSHVIDGADSVRVYLANGSPVEAVVVGQDPSNDLALLKASPSEVEGIEPVALGDSSQLKPGQMAMVIGSPLGYDGSITVGVVSQVGRDLPSTLGGRRIANVVQTDALISHGSSGSPLLDSGGKVIGINMAVQVSHLGQIVDRIGFAVPVDTLKSVLPRLKEGKEDTVVRPAWIGIQAMDLTSQLAEELDLPVQKGAYVTRVIGGGPAEEAGLTGAGVDSEGELASGGDIITAVDGVEVEAVTDVIAYLNSKQPGDVVTLTVIRGGETIELSVTLGEWPEALPRE